MNVHPDTTVESFCAWLRTKPDNGKFNYFSNADCCFAQYLKDTGIAEAPRCGGDYWRMTLHDPEQHHIPAVIVKALEGDTTFGQVKRNLAEAGFEV